MSPHQEWIPPSLRPMALAPLAVFAFGMIAALEVLHRISSTRVLSAQNQTTLNLVRYLPTLGVILMGYAFKGIASALKKVTPWANMSGKWATGSNSVLLDYVNDLEIVAAFTALKRKHWAVAVGLIGAFLCGALVPVANALTYVDLFSLRNGTAMFTQVSAFSFDPDPLAMANGSLKIPWDSTGAKPYARAISEQLGYGPRGVWATADYAFDQFTFPNVHNATVTAEVDAISATMDCQRLRFTVSLGLRVEFSADQTDLEAVGCMRPYTAHARVYDDSDPVQYPLAWLNVTQCSDQDDGDDVRVVAHYFTRTKQGENYTDSAITGFICSPRFATQRVNLSVNATTSDITAFSAVSEPQPLALKTSTEALWIYLQNPLDSDTQDLFGSAQVRGGPYNPTTRPLANVANITAAVNELAYNTDSTADPFMQVVLAGQPEDVPLDVDVFEANMVDYAGNVWAAVISFLARTEVSNELPGTISITDQRIRVRTPVLRTFEALSALLGTLVIVFALGLRPRTMLRGDPGPLAAAGIILSVTDTNTEREMANQALSSGETMTASFQNARFTLRQRNADEGYGVTMDREHNQDQVERVEITRQDLDNKAYQSVLNNDKPLPPVPADDISQGWSPIPLRVVSKVALQVAVVGVTIALGIMLWASNRSDGLCKDTQISLAALTLGISTVLVLLGYCFAGVDASAQSLAVFNILQRRPNRHTIFTDDLTLLGRLSGLGSGRINLALLASAAYIVIIPAMKLVAAGLFSSFDTQVVDHVGIQVDTSLTSNLEKTFNYSHPEPLVKRACDFAEWERLGSFDLRSRAGIIDNLVLTDVTGIDDARNNTADGIIKARVSAIAVDVECEAIPSTHFNLSLAIQPDGNNITFSWYCATEHCRQVFDTEVLQALSTAEHAELPSYVGRVISNSIYQKTYTFGSNILFNNDGSRSPVQLPDPGYWMYLADYTSLGASRNAFRNMTPIGENGTKTWATPGSLNVTMPTIVGASCTRNLSVVSVNATFTRPTQAIIGNGTTLLPWRPVSVDRDSLAYERAYPEIQPYFFQPPIVQTTQYRTSDEEDGMLWSNSLWPTRGSSQNFFELLAADAQYRVQNLSSLLSATGLADSAKHVYTTYCTQMFTELRTIAADASVSAEGSHLQASSATLTYREPRVRQDAAITYVLVVLLVVLAGFSLLVFYHFPSKAILPKAPGSIATRFSLLANSTFVIRIRQERVKDLKQLRNLREPAALGWWHTSSPPSAWRWGVDIGESPRLRSWTEPPSPSPPAFPPSYTGSKGAWI
ncbi:hypothetical protein BJY00DRAFT_221087 [Aspergillus carlsbadensis]|nr:hypothetical protein BJY00DRAFT_221087 [Aspergillus carlsbadensis]